MPKLKTHKGIKKRFKVSATGKVTHKKCGSSHLMSHKSGKQVRRLRKKVQLKVLAETRRIRKAVHQRVALNPTEIAMEKALLGAAIEALDAETAEDEAKPAEPQSEATPAEGKAADVDTKAADAEAAVDPATLPSEAP